MRTLEQRLEWAEEKNAGGVAREDQPRPVVSVRETWLGGSYMTCCDSFRCVCLCPVCGKQSTCGLTHAGCE